MVAGRNRVPRPATGKTALVTFNMIEPLLLVSIRSNQMVIAAL
ncbi:hypothetical protein Y027_5671 [Burkholderia pseudomallei TSV5]|nr:hypothetical protein DP49_4871 [Burkholderia pseudomallei]KGX49646.1 hypothetical protein Y027_5671 [Burkholderia pseudomallei TSV5]